MANRLVVADASPLIGLAAADAFVIMRALFGVVTVTTTVNDEVRSGSGLPGSVELAEAVLDGWVSVVADIAGASPFPELGPGEASTLSVAIAHDGPCLVLMDDALGRARAREAGIVVSGVVGLLLAAKAGGVIDLIRPYLDRLADHGFRISPEIVAAALLEARES